MTRVECRHRRCMSALLPPYCNLECRALQIQLCQSAEPIFACGDGTALGTTSCVLTKKCPIPSSKDRLTCSDDCLISICPAETEHKSTLTCSKGSKSISHCTDKNSSNGKGKKGESFNQLLPPVVHPPRGELSNGLHVGILLLPECA